MSGHLHLDQLQLYVGVRCQASGKQIPVFLSNWSLLHPYMSELTSLIMITACPTKILQKCVHFTSQSAVTLTLNGDEA